MQQTQQLGFNLTPPGKCTDLPLLPVLPSACLSQHTVRIKVRKVVWYRFHLRTCCLLTTFSQLSIVNIICRSFYTGAYSSNPTHNFHHKLELGNRTWVLWGLEIPVVFMVKTFAVCSDCTDLNCQMILLYHECVIFVN